jgi:hypothetical protein
VDSLRCDIGAGDRVRPKSSCNKLIRRVASSHRLLTARKASRCAGRDLAKASGTSNLPFPLTVITPCFRKTERSSHISK